jgi:aminopeptidase YwaD
MKKQLTNTFTTHRVRLTKMVGMLVLWLSMSTPNQILAQITAPVGVLYEVERTLFLETVEMLAHDSLEGRNTASEGSRKAARYLTSQLREMGVRPNESFPDYRQEVTFVQRWPADYVALKRYGAAMVESGDVMQLSGQNGIVQGETVFLEYGDRASIEKADLKGKVLVVRVGDGQKQSPGAWIGTGQEKRKLAAEKGAVALIELYEPGKFPWSMIRSYQKGGKFGLAESGADIAHLWVYDPGLEWAGHFSREKEELEIEIEGARMDYFTDDNIVGYLPGTDAELADELILYTAHYDHVGIGKADARGDSIYNGARDNAVGVATVLAIAQHLALFPPRRPAMFVFFTGEEKGLLGSRFFLEQNPIDPGRIRLNLNFDNGGYTDTDMITIIGAHKMDGFESVDEWLEDVAMRHYEPMPLAQSLFYQSDNIHFARAGIPAPTVSMGFTAFNDMILPYYHQAADSWESLDKAYMVNYIEGVLHLTKKLIDMEELPYWKEGDPYFEAGSALYKR